MGRLEKALEAMRADPSAVRFADLERVRRHHFGDPRQCGTSHQVYKMPWPGDPRVNIQNDHGRAKACQVKQDLAAIDKPGEQEGRP